MRSFAESLKNVLSNLELTQYATAKRTGLPQSTISKSLTGKLHYSPVLVDALEKEFNVNPEYMQGANLDIFKGEKPVMPKVFKKVVSERPKMIEERLYEVEVDITTIRKNLGGIQEKMRKLDMIQEQLNLILSELNIKKIDGNQRGNRRQ